MGRYNSTPNIQQPVFVLQSAQDSLPLRVDCVVVNFVKPVWWTASYICPPPALSVPHPGLGAQWLKNVYERMSLLFLTACVKYSPSLSPPKADVSDGVLLGSEQGKLPQRDRAKSRGHAVVVAGQCPRWRSGHFDRNTYC